ncbi:Alpha-(1,3)-fucosyltransferase 9 [Merluccius polli]|uniref:Fucosyltransferase n=1 Tax=Merluccius polli TaxID=89951 RepID=A0AA47N405_MERPO|nr:Alpha-(1,3)-fucosyltransferase 9 [Merluccius polli]
MVLVGSHPVRLAMTSFAFSQWTLHQRIGFCTFIVLCSLRCFFMYNNIDHTFYSNFLKVTYKQEVSENIQGNVTLVPAPTTEEPRKLEIPNPETIILIWMYPFGSRFSIDCSGFEMKGCHITDDRTLYSKAHAVLFHHRDLRGDLSNMPKEPRPWFQKWLWWNRESPQNSHPIPQTNNLFNATLNYRLDSTVPVPYGFLSQRPRVEDDFKIPAKDKLVCWIVSNWNNNDKRVKFYNELKKHIKIDTYGGAFGKRISSAEAAKIITSCKFYLSFENSIYKDYMTEKLYNPLLMGTVPIVLGPPRDNYEQHVIGTSFIHFEDFATPEMLADKLRFLDQNETEYMQYFTWRRNFMATRSDMSKDVCLICNYLKHNPGYQLAWQARPTSTDNNIRQIKLSLFSNFLKPFNDTIDVYA